VRWDNPRSTLEGLSLSSFRMTSDLAGAEFLEHFQRDTLVRWSSDDLAAQGQFVNGELAGREWLDWSSPASALQLIQATRAETFPGAIEQHDALVLAGPVVEMLKPAVLFGQAAALVRPAGRLIAIVPCLRDNSPESREFMRLAASSLWPYCTAEELLEMMSEAGWKVEAPASGFIAIPRFNQAVLRGELGFGGFTKVFEQLMADGYDPVEVGWGELRLAATLE
jgi:hypothetical protein